MSLRGCAILCLKNTPTNLLGCALIFLHQNHPIIHPSIHLYIYIYPSFLLSNKTHHPKTAIMSNVLQSLKTQSSRVLGRMTSLGNGSNNNNNNNNNNNGDSNTNNEDDNGMELQPPQSMNQKNNIKNTPRSGGSFQRLFGGNDSEKNGNDDDDDDDDEENDSQQEILMEENENENENENSWTEELSNYCPKLNFRERLIGFVSCFGLGYLIAFFSFRFFIKLMEGHPIPFAINYTTGHVLQLLSSMFLCGPKRQFRYVYCCWLVVVVVSNYCVCCFCFVFCVCVR